MRKTALPLILAAVAVLLAFWLALRDAGEPARQQRSTTAGSPVPLKGASTPETPDSSKEEEAPAGWTAQVRLVDGEDRPVAGAIVGRFEALEFKGPTVVSDEEGRCRPSLPKGQSWVALGVRHSAYIFKTQWVPAGLEKEVTIKLTPGAPLTVVVLAPDKQPVAGAAVKAEHTRRQGAVGFWSWRDTERYGSGRTDTDGKAALGGMPQVAVAVTVDHPDYALHQSTVEIRGPAIHEHIIHLDAGGVLEGKVLDPDGEGVEGAEVKLRGAVRPQTRSGPGGAFRLESVGVGTAEVIATADGFGPGFFGERLGWDDPVPIHVRAGDTVSGIEIVLGHATFLLGRVIDRDAKQPVGGVKVYGWISGAIAFDQSAESDADGKFRVGPFTVRERGQAQLWFNAGDHVIDQVSGKFVEPGKDLDVGTVKATRKATVRGVVVDEEGQKVDDAMVTVRPGHMSVGVKPDGTFEVAGLRPGKVSLQAESQDPARKSWPVQLQVAVGEVRDSVEIALRPARSIKGRVITPDGKPRLGADVAIQPLDYEVVTDEYVYTSYDHASPGLDGRFEFAHLPEGRYRVGVRDSSTRWNEPVKFRKDPAPRDVEAGADDLEFILPLKGGIVTARVVSKRDGRPLPKFEATFIRYKFFLPAGNEMTWGVKGRLRRELDDPGTWQVDISAAGHAPHRTDRFTLKTGDVKDLGTLRLGEGGTISGTVRDAQGQPVPYTRINILNAKFQTNDDEPFTDQEGNFTLKGISPGTYTVFAISPRHPLVMVPGVAVKEGRRAQVDLEFVPSAPLTIAVTGPGGEPVPGAQLSFTFPAIAPLHSKLFRNKIPPGYGSHKADAEGIIHQYCLPPGEVTITIEAGDHEPKTKKLELKSGEANRVEIRLRRKAK